MNLLHISSMAVNGRLLLLVLLAHFFFSAVHGLLPGCWKANLCDSTRKTCGLKSVCGAAYGKLCDNCDTYSKLSSPTKVCDYATGKCVTNIYNTGQPCYPDPKTNPCKAPGDKCLPDLAYKGRYRCCQ
eukprot:TRINITY_DN10184_c0_g1_i2.p1 TRINITY_DN10184_c0_g1~~TRINITY_DN10184_c0_g1_i2.p1  ORF type:complete len:128 (+),score=0.06 TRINITY_DN10184_c0_g1_i2:59-442(+)